MKRPKSTKTGARKKRKSADRDDDEEEEDEEEEEEDEDDEAESTIADDAEEAEEEGEGNDVVGRGGRRGAKVNLRICRRTGKLILEQTKARKAASGKKKPKKSPKSASVRGTASDLTDIED